MNRKSTVVLQSNLYVKCKVQPLVLVPDPPYSRDPTLFSDKVFEETLDLTCIFSWDSGFLVRKVFWSLPNLITIFYLHRF